MYELRAEPMPQGSWLHPLYPDVWAPTGATYPAWDVPAAPYRYKFPFTFTVKTGRYAQLDIGR